MLVQKSLIVVADDDPGIVKLVSLNLQLEGYRVITAADGKEAVRMAHDEQPALVLLDVMMPVIDGLQACELIRQFSEVPIIMLTAKDRSEDIVRGLDMGADDYVVKPFNVNELAARVNAVLHRTRLPQEVPQPVFATEDLVIDFAQYRVTVSGKDALLTPTEYRVLCLLARNAGRVITYEQLLTEVWGHEYQGDTHILQVVVARLRKRLGDNTAHAKYIATRPGTGYIFNKSREESPIATTACAVQSVQYQHEMIATAAAPS